MPKRKLSHGASDSQSSGEASEASVSMDESSGSDFEAASSPITSKKKKLTGRGPESAPPRGTKNVKAPVAVPSPAQKPGQSSKTRNVTSSSVARAAISPAKAPSTNKASAVVSAAAASRDPHGSSACGTAFASADITQGAPVASEAAAKKLVLQYMKLQNRPYSVIQVFDNLHQRVAKPTVQRCLDSLSEDGGGLRCKEYGKAKIYYVDQSSIPAQASEEDMKKLDADIAKGESRLSDISSVGHIRKRVMDTLADEPADGDIESILSELRSRVSGKQQRLESVKTTNVDEAARDDLIDEHNYYLSLWKRRKSQCMYAVDLIADGMEKSRVHVASLMGLETDVDAGATLPAAIPATSRRI